MPKKTWALTDVDRDVYVEDLAVAPADVGGAASGYAVRKRTLRGGLRDGLDAIEVDNGRLRFVVLPDRGMGIWKAWCGDVELGWRSPALRPVHPRHVPLFEPSGIGWLTGFGEWLCRCGLESNGAPEWDPGGRLKYPLHGKIANAPAHRVELSIDGDTGEIAITGVVDESRLFGSKLRLTSTIRAHAGEAKLSIRDEVTNLSATPGEFELIYHINFGLPLLTPGAKFVAPVKTLVPRDMEAVPDIATWDTYGPYEPGIPEHVHFIELANRADGGTQTLLHTASGDRGVSLAFNRRQLPAFTLWKLRQGAADGYVTGFEPGVNYPNVRSYEERQGRIAKLKPGETRAFDLQFEIHSDAAAVRAAEQSIAEIAAGVPPRIHEQPQPGWSLSGEG
jgi:galactose mutarotase-like enzyme